METGNVSAHIELASFIRSVWMRNSENQQDLMMNLFAALIRVGCDYYDLIDLYAEHSLSVNDLKILVKHSPAPKAILPITPQNIRANIFRWSASKYRTDSISRVVEDIYQRLHLGKTGIAVYNSNRNPKSRRSLNDRYILLMVNDDYLFFDISRKSVIKFQKE